MIQASVDIERFVKELSENVDAPVDLYLGGGSMMYAGLKYFTKDIDLVVRTEGEYKSTVDAMRRMGFQSIRPGAEYSRMNLPICWRGRTVTGSICSMTGSAGSSVYPTGWHPVRSSGRVTEGWS